MFAGDDIHLPGKRKDLSRRRRTLRDRPKINVLQPMTREFLQVLPRSGRAHAFRLALAVAARSPIWMKHELVLSEI